MHVLEAFVKQGISFLKLQEKIQLDVSYDHSGIPEHYIIGLHRIKHTW